MNFIDKINSGETIEIETVFSVDKTEVLGTKCKIADSIFISSIMQDERTNIQTYEISFLTEGKFKTIPISSDDILPNRVSSLTRFGINLDTAHSKELARYLVFQKKLIPITKVVNKAGWINKDDKLLYVTAEKNEYPISYGGNLAIVQNGTYEDWLVGVQELVLNNVELELILAISLSTVLIGYDSVVLGKDIGSAVINLFGDSSTGKSTSAILALSCFGQPNSQEKGTLLKSFSSTKNSIIKSLEGLNGVMVCLDDLSASSSSDISDLLYNIGNGKEKDRLSESITMQEGASFVTQVLATGEESFEQYTKKTGGIGVRYVEFEGLQYTKTAEHSEKIKQVFQKNYGFAAPIFAKYLLSSTDSELSDKLDSSVKKLNELFPSSNGKIQRFIKRIAAINVTAELLETCFDISIDKEGITRLLVENIKKQSLLLDYSMATLDMVVSWITKKQNYFSIDSAEPKNNGDVYGEINSKEGYVKLPKAIFENMVQDLGLPATTSILKAWNKGNLIKHEENRLYYRDSAKQHFVWLKCAIKLANNSIEDEVSDIG